MSDEMVLPEVISEAVANWLLLIECPDCGDYWCPTHGMHYADCECPGLFDDEGEE